MSNIHNPELPAEKKLSHCKPLFHFDVNLTTNIINPLLSENGYEMNHVKAIFTSQMSSAANERIQTDTCFACATD
ncbi:MAG: hypothetical protein LBI42_06750 [Chitinispirillales bacterium]|jgi:hypothetical protein|nr:hypothetical protein [Chitinispirillales bacterium]